MNQDATPAVITIPIDDAIAMTANWRNSEHRLTANSFLLNADDFRAILKEPSIAYIRLYIGLQVASGTGQNELIEKLLCVGVDQEKKDILGPKQQVDEGGYVYDFSHPCPPLCYNPESPLAG